MPLRTACSSYKESNSLGSGRGIACCDLDGTLTTCKGDLHLCEKLDVLTIYLPPESKGDGHELSGDSQTI